SVVSTDFFFIKPTYSLTVESADDIAELVVFSVVAIVISVLQTAQKKAKTALQALNEKLEERVKERTAWLSLVSDITRAANETETVDQAFRFVLKRITADGLWRLCHVYGPSPDGSDSFCCSLVHAASEDPRLLKLQDRTSDVRILNGDGPLGRVRDSAAVEWI